MLLRFGVRGLPSGWIFVGLHDAVRLPDDGGALSVRTKQKETVQEQRGETCFFFSFLPLLEV